MILRVLAWVLVVLLTFPWPAWSTVYTDGSTLATDRGSLGLADPSAGALGPEDVGANGALRFSYPIWVPPGTGGMQPKIAVNYQSTPRSDSWVGYGWQLGFGSIQRSLKEGVPTYDDELDTFVLDGSELVEIDTDEFRTKRESFLKIDYVPGEDIWEVRRKDGTILRYGASSDPSVPTNARIIHPDPGGDPQYDTTFSWLLTEMEDLNGNALRIFYQDDPELRETGVRYPHEVRYTLHRGASQLESLPGGDRIVRFLLEDVVRPDVSVKYSAGLEQRLRWRLATIEVEVGGAVVRGYDLHYTESPDSYRSLLSEVHDRGAQSGGQYLADAHVTTLAYRHNAGDPNRVGFEGADAGWPLPEINFVAPGGKEGGARIADMDGDGYPDLVRFIGVNPDPENDGIYFNEEGASFADLDPNTLRFPLKAGDTDHHHSFMVGGEPTGTLLVDLNRDGRADLLHAFGYAWEDNGDTRYKARFEYVENLGSDWEPDAERQWERQTGGKLRPDDPKILRHSFKAKFGDDSTYGTGEIPLDGRSALADLNGDGRPDIISRYTIDVAGSSTRRDRIYSMNRGDSFDGPWDEPYQVCPDSNCDDSSKLILYATHEDLNLDFVKRFGAREFDVNGDGLDDHYVAFGGRNREVYLNNGHDYLLDDASNGWDLSDDFVFDRFDANEEVTRDEGTRIVDLNGDGRLDVFRYKGTATHLAFNTGNPEGGVGAAWDVQDETEREPWVIPDEPFVNGLGVDMGIRFADLNGDGMLDMIRMRTGSSGSNRWIRFNKGEVPDLLSSVENHLGGITSITYAPEMVPGLGVLQVVDSIETDALAGDPVQRSTYAYSDPEYDSVDREFRGFGVVTVTRLEPLGGDLFQVDRTVETVYKQGAEDFGLPETVTVTGGGGELRRTEFSYTTPDIDPPFVSLLASTEVHEAGSINPRVSLTEFEYDHTYGNLTARIEHGETSPVASTLDDRRFEFEYTVAPSINLVNTVSRQRVCGGVDPCGAVFVRETIFYYDGNGSETALPTKGNLTKRVEIFDDPSSPDPEEDPTTTYGYDSYGNVTSITDPRKNAGESNIVDAEIAYDDLYETFPTSIWNAHPDQHETRLSYGSRQECAGANEVAYPVGAGFVQFEEGPNDIDAALGTGWIRCYDAFGRRTLERAPADLAETTWVYDDLANTVTEDRRATDLGGLRTRIATFDGLGRVIQTRSSGASEDVYEVRHLRLGGTARAPDGSLLRERDPAGDSFRV